MRCLKKIWDRDKEIIVLMGAYLFAIGLLALWSTYVSL
jgi:hypothetical protein